MFLLTIIQWNLAIIKTKRLVPSGLNSKVV